MDKATFMRLEPMTVASFLGFGAEPENLAWRGLAAWLDAQGLSRGGRRYFGFNNPNPSPGSGNYGYEQWAELATRPEGAGAAEEAQAGGIVIKAFGGGSYLCLTHEGSPERLPLSWSRLLAAAEASPYRMANRPCLEECLTPELAMEGDPSRFADWRFRLYLAVDEY